MSENSTEPTTPDTADAGKAPDATPETDWKAEARKWEQRAKENSAKLREAEPKLADYDRLEQAKKTELQLQTEQTARWQAEAEKWRTASVGSRIEVLASADFADPSDAATALADPSKYLDAGGVIDEAAIKADLAAVLEKKPHWRRPDGTPAAPTARVPAPNTAQGSSAQGGSAQSPAQEFGALLRAEMTRT